MRQRKRSKTEQQRKLREKEIYDHLKGLGDRNYYAWDQNLMAEIYSVRRPFHDNIVSRYLKGKRVLMLGCGKGYGTKELNLYAKQITGIDISERMIKLARASYPDPGTSFITGDAENTPFKNNSFDVVYCKAILHHLNLPRVLKEIRRVLTPDGYLYVVDECGLLNPIAWIRRRFFPSEIHTPDERPFIPNQFRKILYRHGFHEIDFEYRFIISPVAPVLARVIPRVNLMPLVHFLLGVDKLLLQSPLKQLCWRIGGIYTVQP
jgi:ubiquinone/menaquinone biosynthesis C-methylase UbiE